MPRPASPRTHRPLVADRGAFGRAPSVPTQFEAEAIASKAEIKGQVQILMDLANKYSGDPAVSPPQKAAPPAQDHALQSRPQPQPHGSHLVAARPTRHERIPMAHEGGPPQRAPQYRAQSPHQHRPSSPRRPPSVPPPPDDSIQPQLSATPRADSPSRGRAWVPASRNLAPRPSSPRGRGGSGSGSARSCADMCHVTGFDEEATIRSEARFTIHACGSDGQASRSGGERFRVTFRGRSAPQWHLRDNGDGTYTGTYTASVSGDYELIVMLDGEPIRGSPYRLTVKAGIAAPELCMATGEGLEQSHAGQRARFYVKAVDTNGLPKASGGDTFVAAIFGPAHPNVPDAAALAMPPQLRLRLADQRNGGYTGGYTLSMAGTYILVLQEETTGEPVCNSPYRVTVHAGPLHPPSCALRPMVPMCTTIAGDEAMVDVELYDAHGNALPHEAARQLRVRFAASDELGDETDDPRSARDPRGTARHHGPLSPPVRPAGCVAGAFGSMASSVFSERAASSGGSHLPTAASRGARGMCAGGGFGSEVGAACGAGTDDSWLDHPDDSSIEGTPRAGEQHQPDDESRPSRARGGEPTLGVVECTLKPFEVNKRKTTRLLFRPTRAGPLRVAVLCGTEMLGGAPLAWTVEHAETHSDACVVRGGGAREAVAGEAMSLAVYTRDRYANACRRGGDEISAEIRGKHCSPVACDVIDLNSGEHRVNYTANVGGMMELHVFVRRCVAPHIELTPSCIATTTHVCRRVAHTELHTSLRASLPPLLLRCSRFALRPLVCVTGSRSTARPFY